MSWIAKQIRFVCSSTCSRSRPISWCGFGTTDSSKMGISPVSSYCGAQVFEAVGLDGELLQRYFTGTSSRMVAGPWLRASRIWSIRSWRCSA